MPEPKQIDEGQKHTTWQDNDVTVIMNMTHKSQTNNNNIGCVKARWQIKRLKPTKNTKHNEKQWKTTTTYFNVTIGFPLSLWLQKHLTFHELSFNNPTSAHQNGRRKVWNLLVGQYQGVGLNILQLYIYENITIRLELPTLVPFGLVHLQSFPLGTRSPGLPLPPHAPPLAIRAALAFLILRRHRQRSGGRSGPARSRTVPAIPGDADPEGMRRG